MKFPPSIHLIPLSDAEKVIITLKRVEIGTHVAFVKEGEKPRIRMRMGRSET